MSINDAERRQTAEELTALRELLPATNEELAHRLGYGTDQLAAVLDMRPAVDPREVWRVRDFLVAVAAARGPASGQHRCGTRQAYAPGPQEVASPASSRTSLAMLIADTALGQPV